MGARLERKLLQVTELLRGEKNGRVEGGTGEVIMSRTEQNARLEHLLEKLFDSQREEWKEELPWEEFEQRRHDFVFHMTDWTSDLERLAALFNKPDEQDETATFAFMIGFLYHVVPHLDAAANLRLGQIDNPFPHFMNDQKESPPLPLTESVEGKPRG
jgi:hypothetical protein